MSTDIQKLTELRDKIDGLDQLIHQTLIDRSHVVEEVGQAKKSEGKAFPCPVREMKMLRNLFQKHQGEFPLSSLLQIWREIQSGMLYIQHPFSVAINFGDSEALIGERSRAWFGAACEKRRVLEHRDFFDSLMKGDCLFGTVAIFKTPQTKPWWLEEEVLAQKINAVCRLPLRVGETFSPIVALGIFKNESSDDDCSLVVAPSPSESEKMNVVSEYGGQYLIEVQGHVYKDPSILKQFNDDVRVVGVYPQPISW